MKTNENYVIGLDPNLLDKLTITESIVYTIIKQDCENNDDGVCRLNNDTIGDIIRLGSMMMSITITSLVNKGFLERDLTVRAKRLLKVK